MDAEARVRAVSAEQARARIDDLLEIYADAFAAPPWSVTEEMAVEHRPTLESRLRRPDIDIAVAEDGHRIVGCTYGWSGRLDQGIALHRCVRDAVTAEVAEASMHRGSFAVVELMVRARFQGCGLGRRLLESVVGGRDGWLLTHPQGAGVALYRSAGWRPVGQFVGDDQVPLDVYARGPFPAGT